MWFLLIVATVLMASDQSIAAEGTEPAITLFLRNMSVAEEQTISFVCKASGSPMPKFTWYRDNKRIKAVNRQRYEIKPMPHGSVLRIEPVKARRDSGKFTCEAENDYGDKVQTSAFLHVYPVDQKDWPEKGNPNWKKMYKDIPQGYPRITVNPKLKSIEKGRNAIMKCEAEAPGIYNQEPIQIEWFKDKIPVDLTDPRLTKVDPGYLQIHNSMESDHGRYECVASNSKGVAYSFAAMLYVKVRRVPPHFTMPPKNVEISPYTNVNLTCVAVGSPMPKVKFRAGPIELTPEDEEHIGTNTLVLINVTESKNYTCVASSELGNIEHVVQVKVKEERQNLKKELDKYLEDPAKVIDQLNLEFFNNETEEESQSILTPPVTDNKLDEPQEQSTRHRVKRVIPPIDSDSEKSEEHEHEEVCDDSDKDEDFLPPKNKKQRHEESTTDENASGKAKVKKSKKKKQKQKQTDETDEVKKARKDFCLLKRQKEKLSNETSSMMSRNLLSEDNSMIDELNLLTSAVREVQSSQSTIMARLDSFIETFQCRDCIKQVVKEYKIAVKSGSTPGKEKASKPEEQPQTSKPEEQPQTSKPEKAEQQTSKSEEPMGDISGIEVNESEEDKTTLDDVEHFESNTDALVCLGETRYGIKMKSADLARCEEQSQTAEKFVLNLLEYLVTKSDCEAMTVYGHGKNKREMDPQMRKAIRSHMFSLYKKEMSSEEKTKYWMDTIVVKINDKIRGIKNGKYKSKKQ